MSWVICLRVQKAKCKVQGVDRRASIPAFPLGSFSKTESRIASLIWSVCPSVTDSEVNKYLIFKLNSPFIFFNPKIKNLFKTKEVIFVSHLSELNIYSTEFGTNMMSLVTTLRVAGLHRVPIISLLFPCCIILMHIFQLFFLPISNWDLRN